MSNSRKDKLRVRWAEIKTLETFDEICRKMESSDFLKGNNSRKWKATFDWLLENDNNWVKVIEGNYDNKHVITSITQGEREDHENGEYRIDRANSRPKPKPWEIVSEADKAFFDQGF